MDQLEDKFLIISWNCLIFIMYLFNKIRPKNQCRHWLCECLHFSNTYVFGQLLKNSFLQDKPGIEALKLSLGVVNKLCGFGVIDQSSICFFSLVKYNSRIINFSAETILAPSSSPRSPLLALNLEQKDVFMPI